MTDIKELNQGRLAAQRAELEKMSFYRVCSLVLPEDEGETFGWNQFWDKLAIEHYNAKNILDIMISVNEQNGIAIISMKGASA